MHRRHGKSGVVEMGFVVFVHGVSASVFSALVYVYSVDWLGDLYDEL